MKLMKNAFFINPYKFQNRNFWTLADNKINRDHHILNCNLMFYKLASWQFTFVSTQ